MRDLKKIDEFLQKLGEYWKQVPDWRFGQLVSNIQRFAQQDVFFLEDDKYLKTVEDLFSEA